MIAIFGRQLVIVHLNVTLETRLKRESMSLLSLNEFILS